MEFLTSPPAGGVPASVNQYRARAIIKLYPPAPEHPAGGGAGAGTGMVRRRSSLGAAAATSGEEGQAGGGGGGLRRILSRGSGGAARRDSSGGGAAAAVAGEGDEAQSGGGGGGLRRILSRGGQQQQQGADTSAVVLDSETATGGGGGAPLSRTKSREVVTGKFTAKVAVGTTKTHLVLILSPGETLKPTDGLISSAIDEKARSDAAGEHSDGSGIGGKIMSLFGGRKSSFSKTSGTAGPQSPTNAIHEGVVESHSASTTTAGPGSASAIGSETTAVEPSAHAQQHFAQTQTQPAAPGGFPSHVGGTPVSYVTVPLAAIQQEGIKAIEVNKAGDVVLRVPVESHFSKFVHPMLEDLGREHDDSWGRSGTIKFVFSGSWIGAKAEAEVLQNNIEQALLHNTQAMTA